MENKPTPPERNRRLMPAGRIDVYTLLMVVASLALLIGIGFIWYRGSVLFETTNPFEIVSPTLTGWFNTF